MSNKSNPPFHKSTLVYLLVAVVLGIAAVNIAACVAPARIEAHNVKIGALVKAVNNDPGASEATREAVQAVADDAADMADAQRSMVHSAETGDWKSLGLEIVAGALSLGGAAVAQHKYTVAAVNKQRDATSAQRTAQDIAALGLQPSVAQS